MKKPGFSTARAKPFKLGPLTMVASVMDARSLTFPAVTATTAAADELLSVSYLAFNDAFIFSIGVTNEARPCVFGRLISRPGRTII